MPIGRATIWAILGAYLLLPVDTELDLPMIPPLDKATVPNIAAYLICRFVIGKRIALLPNVKWVRGLLLIYIISPFITALLNPDPIIAGPLFIKGMDYYDALSAVIRQLLFIIPFLLGFTFLRSVKNHEDLLSILVIAGLFYSLPILFEIRMSPQLHRWIYGFFPHSFVQQMRDGGFRPVIFLGHGLWVAFFTMSSVVAASALWKIRKNVSRFSPGSVTFYLAVILLLCKSMASLVYAILAVTLVRLARPRMQVRIAKIIVVLVVLFPMLRAIDGFPVEGLQSMAAEFSEQRAQSLKFRFDNEELLLTHARERAFFGWGSWGRYRVYDKESGRDLSVTDGRWIIVMGEFGWVGYLAEFGLLALPVLRSAKVLKYVKDRREQIVLGAITLLMAVSILDLIPNASVSPWTWLLAGALLGRVDQIRSLTNLQTSLPRKEMSMQVSS